jgi:hypothetical protein
MKPAGSSDAGAPNPSSLISLNSRGDDLNGVNVRIFRSAINANKSGLAFSKSQPREWNSYFRSESLAVFVPKHSLADCDTAQTDQHSQGAGAGAGKGNGGYGANGRGIGRQRLLVSGE